MTDPEPPQPGSTWQSREHGAGWTCKVVLNLERRGRWHVLTEYEIGPEGSGEMEMDVQTVPQFYRAWEEAGRR